MNIYDNIECIYYINLESRVDRNNYIQGHLRERFPDKTIQRFDAFYRSIPRNYPFIEDKCNGCINRINSSWNRGMLCLSFMFIENIRSQIQI